MNEYSERLSYAIDLRKTKQTKLANAIGVSPQAIQYLCKQGKHSVHSVKIADYLNINPKWLTEGIGPMENIVSQDNQTSKHIKESKSEYIYIVDQTEWKALPPQVRALIEDLINKTQNGLLTSNQIKIIQNILDDLTTR